MIGVVAFTWLFLANFLLNAIVQHRGARLGPIDLTQNVSPTRTERLIRWLILIAALGAGAVAATISVQDVVRGGMEAKSLLAGASFFFAAAAIYGASTFSIIVVSGFRIRPVRGWMSACRRRDTSAESAIGRSADAFDARTVTNMIRS